MKEKTWDTLKWELRNQGFNESEILRVYKAISDTCDKRGTSSIRV